MDNAWERNNLGNPEGGRSGCRRGCKTAPGDLSEGVFSVRKIGGPGGWGFLLGWAVLACLVGLAGLGGARAAERPPNVVLILADDVGREAFGCYGGEDYATPEIDRLARDGVRFEQAHATPLCTPTRVMLMTGKYNFRNYTHFGYLDTRERTLGHLLREAGYATAIAGKWQLNGTYNDFPGSRDPRVPGQFGFDEWLLWQVTKEKEGKDGGGERYWNPPLEHNGRLIPGEAQGEKYGPDLFADFLCDFMERHRERPFFVYYPMVLAHDVFVPTPDSRGPDFEVARGNEQPTDAVARKANFVAMVAYLDKMVGRLRSKVEELGLAEDTLFLFTADNGTHPSILSRWRGREVRGGKGGLTDAGTHVPLVARWEGKTPAGAVVADLVDFTDFLPTLAEAAGVAVGPHAWVDGRSFLPQVLGRPGNPREWILCHYQPFWGPAPGQFVRDREYKLYGDGRFFRVGDDLEEKHDLGPGRGPEEVSARARLQAVLDRTPPLPPGRGNGADLPRPVYPTWPRLEE